MNSIIIDKSQLTSNHLGNYKVIFELKNKEKTANYPIDLQIKDYKETVDSFLIKEKTNNQ